MCFSDKIILYHIGRIVNSIKSDNNLKNKLISSKSKWANSDNGLYWWNDDIAGKRNQCNMIRRRLTRSAKRGDSGSHDVNVLRAEYKASRKFLAKQVSKAKKTCLANLCQELDNDICMGRSL